MNIMNKMYNYLISNGIPFDLYIFPDDNFCFHIYLGNHYIMTSGPFDSVDYFNFRDYINNTPADVLKSDLLKHPGNIIHKEYKNGKNY